LTSISIGRTIMAMRALISSHGRWIADQRGEGRAVRVSSHVEGGFLVLSTWKEDTCVSTVRLLPDEAALLVAGLAEGLSRLSERPVDDLATRLAAVEARLAAIDRRE
jgi:hypothetical protein